MCKQVKDLIMLSRHFYGNASFREHSMTLTKEIDLKLSSKEIDFKLSSKEIDFKLSSKEIDLKSPNIRRIQTNFIDNMSKNSGMIP